MDVFTQEQEGDRLREPDPLLRPPSVPHGEGPPDRPARSATPTPCSTATSTSSSRPTCSRRSAGTPRKPARRDVRPARRPSSRAHGRSPPAARSSGGREADHGVAVERPVDDEAAGETRAREAPRERAATRAPRREQHAGPRTARMPRWRVGEVLEAAQRHVALHARRAPAGSRATVSRNAASAAAHESGWPPKVVTCASGGSRVSGREDAARAEKRPERQPAAERLGEHRGDRAGCRTPEARRASPVRPRPGHDLVEDQAALRPRRSASRSRRRKPGSATRTPPSACTGSIDHCGGPRDRSRGAPARPAKGRIVAPGSSGTNGSR